DVARIERTQGPIEIYHHDIDRVDQLLVNVNGNDLAGVAGEVERLVGQLARQYVVSQLSEPRKELAESEDFLRELEVYFKKGRAAERARLDEKYGVDPEVLRLPPGVRATVHGEVRSMRDSFREMAFNLSLAVLLVYL